MMGRLVALLIALNLIWAAWAQGWLRFAGLGPEIQADPARLQRQVRPETVTLRPLQDNAPHAAGAPASTPAPERPASDAAPSAALTDAAPSAQTAAAPPPAAPAASAPAPAPAGTCLMAGIFDDKQIEPVRRAAASLPANSWHIDQVALPSRWMVYIGKLADADAVRAKRAELQNMGISTDRPAHALEPGLSLGRFSSEEQAKRALTDLARKGVRTAQVVQERRDAPGYVLRLPSADAALRQQATRTLRAALGSKELRTCE